MYMLTNHNIYQGQLKHSSFQVCLRRQVQKHLSFCIKTQLLRIVQVCVILDRYRHNYIRKCNKQIQFHHYNQQQKKLSHLNCSFLFFQLITQVLAFFQRRYLINFFFCMKTKIIAISGALEEESPITNLLRKCVQLESNLTIELVSIKDVPLLNTDLFNQEFPPSIKAIRQKVYECEGMIFAVPQFFGKVSPAFKNIFDWLSWSPNAEHPAPIRGMPACMISVGDEEGSSIHKHLLQMSQFSRVQIMTKPTFHITREKIDNFRCLQSLSAQDKEDLETFLQYFSQFVNKKSRAQ